MNDLEEKAKNKNSVKKPKEKKEEVKDKEKKVPEEEPAEQTAPAEEQTGEEKKNTADEYKDRFLRLMAEFDNFKKRTQKEKEGLYDYYVAVIVGKILPVMDTLKLSLVHADEDDPIRKGVELTLKQFDEALAKLNVTEIKALGEKFDPNLHNAVMHVDDDAYGEQEIVEILQAGYKINDKVIRYSMVKVAN